MGRGALKAEGDRRWRHGQSRKRTYSTWVNMMTRCFNEKNHHYPLYGGRGITVCPEWTEFAAFFADMGERPAGMSLERIDNDGSYAPANCRWATHSEQCRNRRTTRAVVRGDGERFRSMAEAAEKTTGSNLQGIQACCSGRQLTHVGQTWRYA